MTTKHQSHRRAAMIPAETVSRLRRLADDWRKEEKQLCDQFGNEIVPHSMRARRIKDTKAIDAAVEMIERTAKTELEIRDRNDLIVRLQNELRGYREREKTMGWQE